MWRFFCCIYWDGKAATNATVNYVLMLHNWAKIVLDFIFAHFIYAISQNIYCTFVFLGWKSRNVSLVSFVFVFELQLYYDFCLIVCHKAYFIPFYLCQVFLFVTYLFVRLRHFLCVGVFPKSLVMKYKLNSCLLTVVIR